MAKKRTERLQEIQKHQRRLAKIIEGRIKDRRFGREVLYDITENPQDYADAEGDLKALLEHWPSEGPRISGNDNESILAGGIFNALDHGNKELADIILASGRNINIGGLLGWAQKNDATFFNELLHGPENWRLGASPTTGWNNSYLSRLCWEGDLDTAKQVFASGKISKSTYNEVNVGGVWTKVFEAAVWNATRIPDVRNGPPARIMDEANLAEAEKWREFAIEILNDRTVPMNSKDLARVIWESMCSEPELIQAVLDSGRRIRLVGAAKTGRGGSDGYSTFDIKHSFDVADGSLVSDIAGQLGVTEDDAKVDAEVTKIKAHLGERHQRARELLFAHLEHLFDTDGPHPNIDQFAEGTCSDRVASPGPYNHQEEQIAAMEILLREGKIEEAKTAFDKAALSHEANFRLFSLGEIPKRTVFREDPTPLVSREFAMHVVHSQKPLFVDDILAYIEDHDPYDDFHKLAKLWPHLGDEIIAALAEHPQIQERWQSIQETVSHLGNDHLAAFIPESFADPETPAVIARMERVWIHIAYTGLDPFSSPFALSTVEMPNIDWEELEDTIKGFARYAVLSGLARELDEEALDQLTDADCTHLAEACRGQIAEVIFQGKSAKSIEAVSDMWHWALSERAILTKIREFPEQGVWHQLLPRKEIEITSGKARGWKVIELTTAEELDEQGHVDNMGTCIAGFSPDCRAGDMHAYLFVDEEGASRATIRVNVVESGGDINIPESESGFEIITHMAKGDHRVTPEHYPIEQAAYDWFAQQIESGEMQVDLSQRGQLPLEIEIRSNGDTKTIALSSFQNVIGIIDPTDQAARQRQFDVLAARGGHSALRLEGAHSKAKNVYFVPDGLRRISHDDFLDSTGLQEHLMAQYHALVGPTVGPTRNAEQGRWEERVQQEGQNTATRDV